MSIQPKEIQHFPSGELGILWEDGHESIYRGETLRRICPCAMCSHDLKRGMGIHPGRFTIIGVRKIGGYAIALTWADGHDTGIYSFDALRKACECEKCSK
ncbi:MAG: DUF971 domain-containing protein [Chlamydiae bacterium]|nr:DUF971 domain-containing protein [Chlamydiota bacterium]MBI3277237.1 DUF971 domain-containing protein [Chlamydiota bacterium]